VANKKTKQGLKAWIPAGVYPREDRDGNDREERIRERGENSGTKKKCGTNTYLGSLTSRTKRDFGRKYIL